LFLKSKQKKKQKDKKIVQSTTVTSNTLNHSGLMQQPPTNLQIQQQFETLQNQQNQLTSSASFHCVSTSTTTPTKQIQSGNSTNNHASSNGNSSPAFKSIFKNLRGSLKQQSTNSSSQNSININSETEFKNLLTPPTNPNLNSLTNSSSLIRTNSGNTFKTTPLTTSVYSINSPNTERKLDYSSCISQLQSAAALAKSSIQNSSSPGVNSPSTPSNNQSIENPSLMPVLFRNNKLNQSIKSNHSSKNINANLNANQEVLSSFLIGSSDTSTANLQTTPTLFSTFNKSETTPSNLDQQQQRRCK